MSEQVQVTVIYGSVNTWKDGSFKKGDVFVTSKSEAEKIDPRFVSITALIKAPVTVVPAVVEAAVLEPVTPTKKAVTKKNVIVQPVEPKTEEPAIIEEVKPPEEA